MAWWFLVVKFSLNWSTSAFHHIQHFKMVKFCHETKTGHLFAIALEKSKSKASWRNTFSLNSFSDWPKNCKDLCAIYKLGWNLPQYANGFKPHSQLKQKTFLSRDMSFLQRAVSHCVCRVGHANTLIWGICVFLHHYTHTITHDFFLPLPSHIQQK